MLHILWVIVKIILIVLGSLLGLLLLALLLLLFCPVRYRGTFRKQEPGWRAAEGTLDVSWLLHLLSFQVRFCRGKPEYSLRILGISPDRLLRRKKSRGYRAAGRGQRTRAPAPETEERETEDFPEDKNAENGPDTGKAGIAQCEDAGDTGSVQRRETGEAGDAGKAGIAQREEAGEAGDTGTEEKSAGEEPEDSRRDGLFHRIWGKLKMILESLSAFVKKVSGMPKAVLERIQKIQLTAKNIYDKIEWWKEFLTHPRTKEALVLVRGEAMALVRHVFPTRIRGNVTFGCEDPAAEGAVLAVLGMSFPLHKNRIAVTPLFDGENHLTAEAELKGRIYGCVCLMTALKIYFNRNVKYVISRWKHKED